MEGNFYNTIQKNEEQGTVGGVGRASSLPDISFVPKEITKMGESATGGFRDKSALGGVLFGGLSVFSWVVILLGVFCSVAGIAFSTLGLKSRYAKYARIGIVLSVVGLVASFGYAFAAYQGMINYNYFTTEFWGVK